jgi:hypothetical protein
LLLEIPVPRPSAVLLCAALAALSPAALAGKDDGPTAAAFTEVVRAWRARDAAGVVARMPKDARLTLVLDGAGGGRINATPTRENAQALLKGYFERVDAVSLKDVTPADARSKTRAFDYGYRPRGGEAKATRLSFTLVAVEGGWALAGVEERPRPR